MAPPGFEGQQRLFETLSDEDGVKSIKHHSGRLFVEGQEIVLEIAAASQNCPQEAVLIRYLSNIVQYSYMMLYC